jgi:hypothetical protein
MRLVGAVGKSERIWSRRARCSSRLFGVLLAAAAATGEAPPLELLEAFFEGRRRRGYSGEVADGELLVGAEIARGPNEDGIAEEADDTVRRARVIEEGRLS